ncbi:MAG: DUF2497 domain-containing protein [Pseudorhizobium sp.]
MAQPSVAREPSMEEILASIRRIIESNEPQENPLQASLPPVYAEEEFDEDEISIVAELAANDPGLPAREPSYRPFSEPQQDQNFSLADVAARVRAASDRPAERRFQPAATTAPMTNAPAPSAPMPLASTTEPAARQPEPVYREQPRPAPEAVQQQARVSDVPTAPAPRALDAARPEAPVPVDHAEQQGLPAKIEAAMALISDEAGAQVARSFGELAAAFDGVQNRSLEELAQEMLRPMLQEWLDDNLPTLVERLVREEIERVARGPRR